MKGHKKQRCNAAEEIVLPCGSVYTGAVYDNKPSGRGRLDSEDLTYEGDFLNGERHGKGIEIKESGSQYSGQWLSNMYHGYGCLKRDTIIYEGMFRRNRYHGKGKLIKNLPNGQQKIYIGQFSQGSKHGQGKHTTAEGIYEGEFYYDMRHGNGTFTNGQGCMYSGHWRRGVEHGTGVYTSSEETYTGDWSRGKRHGKGRWNSKYRGNYNGHWKRGLRHGKGVHVYNSGEQYTGGFSSCERTGFGVMINTNKQPIFSGFWLKDVYNGRGTLIEDGIAFKGTWEEGVREGMFEETRPDGSTLSGPWTNDLRHGTFATFVAGEQKKKRKLYLWGQETTFKKKKDAKSAAVCTIKKNDYQTASAILDHYPSLLTWHFIYKHDQRGIFLHMLSMNVINKNIQKYAFKCFKSKRYVFLEHLVECLPEDVVSTLRSNVSELFDALTAEFVPNPWIANKNSYSESTKQKLLEGLHLGEFGRCEPKDPFTRLQMTEKSGKYLNTTPKLGKILYQQFAINVMHKPSVEQVAYVYNIQDFEEMLKNARDADDKVTVLRLMKERNRFISESAHLQ